MRKWSQPPWAVDKGEEAIQRVKNMVMSYNGKEAMDEAAMEVNEADCAGK